MLFVVNQRFELFTKIVRKRIDKYLIYDNLQCLILKKPNNWINIVRKQNQFIGIVVASNIGLDNLPELQLTPILLWHRVCNICSLVRTICFLSLFFLLLGGYQEHYSVIYSHHEYYYYSVFLLFMFFFHHTPHFYLSKRYFLAPFFLPLSGIIFSNSLLLYKKS